MTLIRTTCTFALRSVLLLASASALAESRPPALDGDADDAVPLASRSERVASMQGLKFGLDPIVVEAARLQKMPTAAWLTTVRARPFFNVPITKALELRVAAQLDGDGQAGGGADYQKTRAALSDTYLRYRFGDARLTIGAQTIVWGRVDAIPVIDRVSRVDLRRFALDDLSDRRLPQWALRYEQAWGQSRIDAVWLPHAQSALLPDERSVWHPVDRTLGQIAGVPANSGLQPFFQAARIRLQERGSGGLAARFTHTGETLDVGVTLAHTRQPLPYVTLSPAIGEIIVQHPYNRFVGLDAELTGGDATWRTELGLSGDVPITGVDGRVIRTSVLEWVGGVEFFPGGKGSRVTLQALVRHAQTSTNTLEVKHYTGMNGEFETSADQGRWKAGMRFAFGLNIPDRYWAPKLSFVGWEPHELSLVWHQFSGPARSVIGYYRQRDALALSLKTRF